MVCQILRAVCLQSSINWSICPPYTFSIVPFSTLLPYAGGYNISSLGRINSLDVLCSLDIIKFPSPQSMDGLNMYGQIGEDAFPWSSNPGAGTNSGQYMPPLAYRSSLSQSNNSFSRSSLWPSMNNLVSLPVHLLLIFFKCREVLSRITPHTDCNTLFLFN
jgi:hypothetical protein